MSRSKTIELLNDTGDLEQKMRWILFKQEVAFIWDKTKTNAWSGWWYPGVPIYRRPRGERYGEQTVRFMVQVLDSEIRQAVIIMCTLEYWCRDCQVGWNNEDPVCWSCDSELGVHWHPKTEPSLIGSIEYRFEYDHEAEMQQAMSLRVRGEEFVDSGSVADRDIPLRVRELVESGQIYVPLSPPHQPSPPRPAIYW